MTTIEARITEALTEHFEVRIFGPRCRCGMPLDNGERYAVLAAHQAAVVAGIVAEAQAEAWDECAGGYLDQLVSITLDWEELDNPYRRKAAQ